MEANTWCAALLATAVALAASAPVADSAPADPATMPELPQVVVIGTTPLEGFGLPSNQVPANVQVADSKDMEREHTLNITDYLANNFTGVNISESADNPFQSDISYHGFTASPLLGTPEGLSVYVDGVRVNEAFGDTLNWDLIPQSSISSMTLLSGSNPVFGLNTLGGALVLRTKNGHDDPGTELEAYAGSFDRRAFAGQTGDAVGNFDYFLALDYFDEAGWRDGSSSRLFQLFDKVGWRTDQTNLDLSYTYSDTYLWGSGVTPQSMLDYRYQSTYTPDLQQNLLNFVNFTGTQRLAEQLLLAGDVYYRRLITSVLNGNINDSYLSQDYVGPPIDCAGAPANLTALAYCFVGQDAPSRLVQTTKGIGVQITDPQDLFGWSNQGVLGMDFTDSEDGFFESFVYGPLSPNRLLIDEQAPFNDQPAISVGGENKIYGVYLTDTLSPGKLLHVTASARYNSSTETLAGYGVNTALGAGFNEASPLSGEHTFARVDPSLGLTVTPTDALTFYANYNEASRTPTVIELGCANPAVPCALPNDFASDPNLKQVVARTAEVGARGNVDDRLVWSGDIFRTQNDNDIQFVATSINSAGYFANVGSTRRQGLDLALGGTEAKLHWRVAYSLVDATYESSFALNSPSNSTADANGNILVTPGDRIPLIPKHTGRLILDYDVTPRLTAGGNVVAVSGSTLHGNENNANRAGGTNAAGAYVEGSGWISGYAVVNLQGTYRLDKHVEVFARAANLLDKRYATAGFLTSDAFNANGTLIANPNNWSNENAISPGAPIGIWAGVRATFR
jgi:outer membrane receptor protein involved in Fe transport